ncbi:hypothetical protein [Jeotgalibaca ciconiae]|uniref:Polysaccharide polymerase n=1 Tax=Jeotgalibaca ciconiae TaxID=2496265 RepID=A0A3S9HC15_9LACT|nr:hypothetical protein [Jeotgalibaca ciconiae]AZP04919.1 hypothetical protein EJN90_09860 [Jeotgalibaca ciconiae]
MTKYIDFFEKNFDVGLMVLIFLKTFIIMGNVSQDPSFFSNLDSLSNLLLLALLLIKRWTPLELGVLLVATPMLVLTHYLAKDGALLWSFLIIMLVIGVPKKKVLISYLTAAVAKNAMTFILSFFGLYHPFTQLKPGTDIVRYNFGFAHANTLHMFCFVMVACYLVIRQDQIKKYELVILLLLNFLLFYYSFSRTATMLIVLLIAISFVLTFNPFKINQYMKKIMKYAIIITFAGAFLVMILSFAYHLTPNNLIELFNRLLSRRIEQANWYFTENGLSLMGQYIPEIFVKESMQFVLDNGYMRVLIQFGFIPFILLMTGLILTSKRLYEASSYYELSMLCVSLIFFILENYLGFIFINISLVYISVIFEARRIQTYSMIELPFKREKIKELFIR